MTAVLSFVNVFFKKKAMTPVLMFSFVIHAVLAGVAGVWVVAKYIQAEPAKFEAPPKALVKIPPQTRQHRMNLAAREAMAPKPTFSKRIISLRPTAFALPEAPKLDMDQLLTPSPAALSNVVANLNGLGGLGNGQGAGLGGSGGLGLGKGFNFMGIQAKGERVLLLFDVSASVLNKANASGASLSKIKEETLQLLAQLPVNARFGIVQFVRNYKPFQSELLPATPANRKLAQEWVETEWNESGQMARGKAGVISPSPNGITAVLEFAFSLKPDTIFLISDGSFQRGNNETVTGDELEKLIKTLQPQTMSKAPVHFIGFAMKEQDKADWQKITKQTGGRLRELVEGAKKK